MSESIDAKYERDVLFGTALQKLLMMHKMALLPRLMAQSIEEREIEDVSFKFVVRTNGREFEKSKGQNLDEALLIT